MSVVDSQRFKDFDKVSQADIQHHVKDIPQLEKEVEELTETVKAMAEQRGVGKQDFQTSLPSSAVTFQTAPQC